jgi:hypothetical protein
MLKRLEGEDERLQGLLAVGELTVEGAQIGAEQLNKDRAELRKELGALEAHPGKV